MPADKRILPKGGSSTAPPLAKFTDVEFAKEYPRQSVADHEVLMAFNGDADALAFRDWWGEQGAVRFGTWLRNQKAR